MIYDKEMMRQAFADCKVTCEKEIQSLDDDIAYFQTIYLLKTRHHGNLLKGFDQYKDSKIFKFNIPKSPIELKNQKIECQERIFSLTSVTCKVNKQYEMYSKIRESQEQKYPQSNRNKYKTQKPVRVIRKVKTEYCEINKGMKADQSQSQTPQSQNKLSTGMQQTKKITKIKLVRNKKQISNDAFTKIQSKQIQNTKQSSTKRRRIRKTLIQSSEQDADICKMINKKIKLSSQSESQDSYQSSEIQTPKKRRMR